MRIVLLLLLTLGLLQGADLPVLDSDVRDKLDVAPASSRIAAMSVNAVPAVSKVVVWIINTDALYSNIGSWASAVDAFEQTLLAWESKAGGFNQDIALWGAVTQAGQVFAVWGPSASVAGQDLQAWNFASPPPTTLGLLFSGAGVSQNQEAWQSGAATAQQSMEAWQSGALTSEQVQQVWRSGAVTAAQLLAQFSNSPDPVVSSLARLAADIQSQGVVIVPLAALVTPADFVSGTAIKMGLTVDGRLNAASPVGIALKNPNMDPVEAQALIDKANARKANFPPPKPHK